MHDHDRIPGRRRARLAALLLAAGAACTRGDGAARDTVRAAAAAARDGTGLPQPGPAATVAAVPDEARLDVELAFAMPAAGAPAPAPLPAVLLVAPDGARLGVDGDRMVREIAGATFDSTALHLDDDDSTAGAPETDGYQLSAPLVEGTWELRLAGRGAGGYVLRASRSGGGAAAARTDTVRLTGAGTSRFRLTISPGAPLELRPAP